MCWMDIGQAVMVMVMVTGCDGGRHFKGDMRGEGVEKATGRIIYSSSIHCPYVKKCCQLFLCAIKP